jgi:hypothetical protein
LTWLIIFYYVSWKRWVFPQHVLIRWIAAFLTNRHEQAVKNWRYYVWMENSEGRNSTRNEARSLFICSNDKRTNRRLALRIKFVDDTSALEILPRNSISLLNYVLLDIDEFASSHTHNMKLNSGKWCLEEFVTSGHIICKACFIRRILEGHFLRIRQWRGGGGASTKRDYTIPSGEKW